jgi:hypothetical protein
MSAKRRRLDFRTTLYIAIILLIIFGVAYFILTPESGPEIYTTEQILTNKQRYIGKTITVEGTYYSDGDVVAKATGVSNPFEQPYPIQLDRSNVNTTVRNEYKYRFTGVLQWLSEEDQSVILIVSEITPV